MSGSWAAGWAVGDVLTATELTKSMGAVFDTTLGSAAASIDITNIPSGYAHLRLVIAGRGDTASNSVTTNLRINGDTGLHYFDVRGAFTDASSAEAGDTTQVTLANCGALSAATASGGYFSVVIIDIPAYASTTIASKVFVGINYLFINAGTGNQTVQLLGGAWNTGAPTAITRLTLSTAVGNFIAGTRATLYVMGA